VAQFALDAKVTQMKDWYLDDGITDMETVLTSLVVNGARKTVSEYTNSGPPDLWALEQLLDKLLAETIWDPPAASPHTHRGGKNR
jgi:hypothetical protein